MRIPFFLRQPRSAAAPSPPRSTTIPVLVSAGGLLLDVNYTRRRKAVNHVLTDTTVQTDSLLSWRSAGPGDPLAWPPDLIQNRVVSISDALELKPVFLSAVPPALKRVDLVTCPR